MPTSKFFFIIVIRYRRSESGYDVMVSVVDPDSLNPDPALQVNPDQDTDPVLDPGF